MSEVRRAAVVIGVVVAVCAAVAVWLLRPAETTGLRRSVSGAPDPFDTSGRIAEAAGARAVFNPAGTRLAVFGGRGVAVAERGRLRFLTRGEVNVVDLAWLPGTTKLLVAEGPALTGRLSLLGVDGKPAGFVALSPPVGFGTGHGMTVDEQRRVAVVTASVREGLGEERLHLVVVDLTTGATRPLTSPDGPDELSPYFTDGGRVAYTVRQRDAPAGRRSWVESTAPSGGSVTRLTPDGVDARAVGTVGGRFVTYLVGRRLLSVPVSGGSRTELALLAESDELVAVDPTGGRVVVARTTPTEVRLQTIAVRRPR